MAEYKYENRNSEGFRFYKAEVMNQFYPMLEETFTRLKELHIIEDCGCGDSVHKRNGYTQCGWCHGCGYRNSDAFNVFLYEQFETAGGRVPLKES